MASLWRNICVVFVLVASSGSFFAFPGVLHAEVSIDELRKQIEAKSAEIRKLEEEALKLRGDISVSQDRQKTLKAELARIDGLLKSLRQDILVTQGKIDKTSIEIVVLNSEIAEREASIQRLRLGIGGLIESLRERSQESPLFVFIKYWR